MVTKNIFITGSSSGIGFALTKKYLAEGDRVTGLDLVSGEHLGNKYFEEVLNDLAEHQHNFLNRFAKPFDLLVFNAGINSTGSFANSDIEKQISVVEINFLAPILLSTKMLELGLVKDSGSIIFISSLAKQLSYPGAATYAGTKVGISSWAESLRADLKARNINVLTVFPGPVDTPHAEQHSPTRAAGKKAKGRMPPAQLASLIYRAEQLRKRTLVPSLGPKTLAAAAWAFPSLVEFMMKKVLYQSLAKN